MFPANPENDSRVIVTYGLESLSTDGNSMITIDLAMVVYLKRDNKPLKF